MTLNLTLYTGSEQDCVQIQEWEERGGEGDMKSSALSDHESKEVSFTLRRYTGSGKTCAQYWAAAELATGQSCMLSYPLMDAKSVLIWSSE